MRILFGAAVVALLCAATVFCEEEAEKKKEGVGTVIGIDLGTTYSW